MQEARLVGRIVHAAAVQRLRWALGVRTLENATLLALLGARRCACRAMSRGVRETVAIGGGGKGGTGRRQWRPGRGEAWGPGGWTGARAEWPTHVDVGSATQGWRPAGSRGLLLAPATHRSCVSLSGGRCQLMCHIQVDDTCPPSTAFGFFFFSSDPPPLPHAHQAASPGGQNTCRRLCGHTT